MGLKPGEVLAGTSYQVVREIGSGGMGVVYEVEHVRLRKRYVAKVIHDQIRGDETAPRRMEREAQVLAELNHPNIVQVHDVGVTADGTSYFVMEKLEGLDLRQAMASGGLSTARAVTICIDVLDALDHVHRRGLVHRDIKPENIFLARTPTGVATKVLDFGVVHIFDAERASQARITKTGGFIGTLYYAAPEQMEGKPAGISNDVYACGLVLYELLAGAGPFDGDPGVGLSRCFKDAPRLEAVPSTLADAVASALERSVERRPTAGELATRLRQALANVATDPGHGPSRGDIDELLSKVARERAAAPTAAFAGTAAPARPLMAGTPASVGNGRTARLGAVHGPDGPSLTSTDPFGSSAIAKTVAAPNVDTSSGMTANVASSTAPPVGPRASRTGMVLAVVGALVVLGLIGTLGLTAFRSAKAPAPSAASEVPPAAPEPRPTAAEKAPAPPPEPTPTVQAPVPAPSAVVAASAVSVPPPPPATPAAKPGAAPPRPKPRGNAEKDGYFNDL